MQIIKKLHLPEDICIVKIYYKEYKVICISREGHGYKEDETETGK